MILDHNLAAGDGTDLFVRFSSEPDMREMPKIIYSEKEFSPEETIHIKSHSDGLITSYIKSPERLLDEICLLMHLKLVDLSPVQQQIIEKLNNSDAILQNKKILIVDDDIRNIFALTSLLERYNMKILSAENGNQALNMIKENPDLDVVIMDIMMPVMDGYETIKLIREDEKFQTIPIIALTAKAMKGDRDKCIEVGASDYISKPVNTEQLISVLRVWLYK
jgi:CheY-like chemotaxis protein